MIMLNRLAGICGALAVVFPLATAAEAGDFAERDGYELLISKPYLPVSFTQSTFDNLWKRWPEPFRSRARLASPDERRRMAFQRYGLTARPGDASGQPLQYTVSEQGDWTINCFACHGGQVAGSIVPGLPNSQFDLQSLVEDTRVAKLLNADPPSPLELASLFMPLATSRGTTNAVMFGVVVMHYRDADLNLHNGRSLPRMLHHDMDAPPWWHLRKKSKLYIDGFAGKGHRALMPFLLAKQNGPQKFREWEDDFRKILTYIESLEPPVYPFSIDRELAARGQTLFNANCAECHGTYGQETDYPEVEVPIDEIGTDPVRLKALSVEHRENYHQSWFAHYGQQQTAVKPAGYVAPPLDGIWASAPYLHNGSVPTLWHLMHADQRPRIWRRTGQKYDEVKAGLSVESLEKVPDKLASRTDRRQYFDTGRTGKDAGGHLFPESLTEPEKRAVLEYLKSL